MALSAALISMGSVSSQWTLEALRKKFDEVDSLDIREMEVRIGNDGLRVFHRGEPIKRYDCVYTKGSFRYAALLHAIASAMPTSTFMPLSPRALLVGRDKLQTHLALQHAGIPQPRTYIAATVQAARAILKQVTFPVVMKLPAGTHGKGVVFADSYESASSMMDTLTILRQPFLIQEYIETGGTDTRAFVVGDRVVAAMQRIAGVGEKRANLHAGGTARACILSAEAQKIAVSAAKACGCAICGVDMLITETGPRVLEINLSPGLQGITGTTGIPVADRIAEFLHAETSKMKCERVSTEAKSVIADATGESAEQKYQIVGPLTVKGERIMLPPIAKKLSRLDEGAEVVIKAERGKITIKGAPRVN